MVMSAFVVMMLDVTMLLAALLSLILQFKGCVENSVLAKLFLYPCLYIGVISRSNNVHSGVIALSVHTPTCLATTLA